MINYNYLNANLVFEIGKEGRNITLEKTVYPAGIYWLNDPASSGCELV